MRFGKISLAALAAASLVSTPVMAQSLSPSAKAVGASQIKRISAKSKQENKDTSGTVIGILAAVAFIGGVVIAAGNNSDRRTSP